VQASSEIFGTWLPLAVDHHHRPAIHLPTAYHITPSASKTAMSFETPGWNIPPPSASVDSNPLPSALNASSNNNKRKRPSAAAGSEEKVASVGVNLEKLMAQMEREEKASKEGGPVGKKAKEREEAKKVKGEAMAKKFEGKPPLPPKGQQGGPAGGKAAGGKKEAGGKGGKGKQQQQPTTPPHNGVPPAVVESAKEVTTSAEEPPMKKTKLTKAEKKRALKAAVDAAGGVDAASLPAPPPAIALPTTVPTPNKTNPAAPSPKSTQVVAPVEEKGKKAGKKEKKKQAAAQAQAQEAKKGGGDVAMSEAGEGEVRNAVEVPMEEDLPVSREPGLTTMQAKMKGRLEGARFRFVPSLTLLSLLVGEEREREREKEKRREIGEADGKMALLLRFYRWINEQLYTTSSDAALEMMKADPTVFADVRPNPFLFPRSNPFAYLASYLSSIRSKKPIAYLFFPIFSVELFSTTKASVTKPPPGPRPP
jgi:hypothetical protein